MTDQDRAAFRELAVIALNVAGGIIFLLGAALAGWNWWLFKRAGTTAVPGEALHALITTGPYRLTRNPMYAGLAVAYVGGAIAISESGYSSSFRSCSHT